VLHTLEEVRDAIKITIKGLPIVVPVGLGKYDSMRVTVSGFKFSLYRAVNKKLTM
jgi:hypothetical protein